MAYRKTTGKSAATTDKTDNYEDVTNRMIAALEAGTIPWRKPWTGTGVRNAISGKSYRGVNVILLSMSQYTDPRWLTYKQATDLGGNVRKGEKGTRIYFWKWVGVEDKKDPDTRRTIPILRAYTVFNVEQCENLDKLKPLLTVVTADKNAECEAVIANMPQKPSIGFGGDRAFYSPMLDHVQMPQVSDFEDTEAYYSTFFHELGHATGHADRLNRKEVTKSGIAFGDCDYSTEELCAELTAAFVCGALGVSNEKSEKNSAAYLQNWLKALRGDKKLVIVAAGQAQKAADFILNRAEEAEVELEEAA